MNLSVPILYSLSVLLIIWSCYFYLGYRSQKKEWQKRVNKWFPEEKRKSAISVWGDRYDQSKNAQALISKLQNANLPLLPSEYIGIHILGFLVLLLLFVNIFNMPFSLSMMIAVGILTAVHFLLFSLRKNKYEERFNEQLGEVCRMLGNAARSGLTISQGIDIVAREVSAPAGTEFKRISHELKLGVSLDHALKSVQKRNKSREFQLFIATLLIQKKTGGNLALTLESMSNTLEDRKVLNQVIKTMTSEQKYISYIVPAMPIFILLVMNNIVEGFIDPLWTGPGIIILILFIAGIVLSFLLIRKITNIRV
ncbi:type II secretion system F family protein [Lederbergia citrea]|uniref:Type II secretion system F family protein n=1 Tax=Lederbergia citrea TaxID=2833581 RepID=A0A942UTQ6_9BACI|nr:type II secretion system F family protein [Lederbergia citrea]MBS4179499.1 type II secretion system F family protein [Lederbergia citrea]MBS4206166.1 type II secretion system F family protein [Lederbergia citrea]MBS4224898.1 type II secretion system F family protein [Lederbergia citrea]